MRTITRNPDPPECLAQQPLGQTWDEFMQTECHRLVDESLRSEQHHVCCYCEAAITADGSHIEHMVPRSVNPGHDYDYTNLAASCNSGGVEHCGRFKDDRRQNPGYRYDAALFCIPHDPDTCLLFRYLTNGDVVASPGQGEEDRQRAAYMIGYLGLSCPRLTGRRRTHARQLMNTLGPNPDPTVLEWAVEYYLQADHNGKLQSFNSLSRTILRR
jgi:uncharacterized protein (TIGR02646 family)